MQWSELPQVQCVDIGAILGGGGGGGEGYWHSRQWEGGRGPSCPARGRRGPATFSRSSVTSKWP